jgi:hypothetical protein
MFDVKYDKDGNVISSAPEVSPEPEKIEPEEIKSEPVIESQDPEVVEEPTPEEAPEVETPRERNTRALRELKEKAEKERIRAEKERDEALRKMQELESRYSKKSESVNEDYDIEIKEDELVEGRHVRKLMKEIRDLKKDLGDSRTQYKTQSLQDRINRDFPDFQRVVTPENIELLRHLKPHQAQLLDQSQDLYATAASA